VNDYAITQAKPELALRAPRFSNYGGLRRNQPYLRRKRKLPTAHCPLF
jgi:hypothetical protein